MPLGTEFAFNVDETKASVWVYEGKVKVFNQYGSVIMEPGKYFAQVLKGQAPKVQIDIHPQDAVNWALYYPPILPYPAKITDIDGEIRLAINEFRHGQVNAALTRLDTLPKPRQTPYFYKIRGAIRLTVGQDKLALQDILALLSTNSNDAEALALQSIRALTQNRKEEAYVLATKAIAANPQSASAYSALSYAEQARFQLEKAQAAANQAVKLAPHDAFVWARKAELELALGLTSDSEQTVQQAIILDANLEHTQTVKGFSHLFKMETEQAIQSFNKAIMLDSTSPLPKLGLGLAKIREGDLEEGRRNIEVAAVLDPNNSLVRSYLGKAYYDEKRNNRAEDQFELAKQRDPKDPTPYFYDAIRKQTTNRPIEALHDMQKAIELNDNRGVYRSKLLLDNDVAARSASLGRIYNDLGFQQRGLLEGWNSINTDPTDYSAHRLLADNYAALPRHEISRLSELLKAQLLQPINITPVQPQVAESNILLLDSLGPTISSFNEYNPLFARNRFALQASGFYGSQGTISDEVVHSGVWDRFSYSLGQFHYQTNGFRVNNQQEINAYNFFAQAKITNNTNAQFEYRRTEKDSGDVTQNFFKKVFSPTDNQQLETDIFRFGLHHAFARNSDLLMSLVHKTEIFNSSRLFDVDRPLNGTQYELQHIYRHRAFDLTAGLNYLINQNEDTYISFGGRSSFHIEHINAEHSAFYLYSSIKAIPRLSITVGLSQDFYKSSSSIRNTTLKQKQNPLNPKFGLIWTPTDATTFRFAAFQSLTRDIIQNQTLEPTQVAGFNQFFDDKEGSISRRIGFGLDHKFSDHFFVGSEVSQRHYEIDLNFQGRNEGNVRKEENTRAYINWAPNDRLALGMDYNFDKLTNKKTDHNIFGSRLSGEIKISDEMP